MQSSSPPFYAALGHGQADKRLAILRQIEHSGSISQAARAVGVSYKAAWQALDTLSHLAGVALLQKAVGGVGGGGTQLTEAARQLLAAADAMQQLRSQAAQQIAQQVAGGADAQRTLAQWSLRTSMRNQWPCLVQSISHQGALARVGLVVQAAADVSLHARITGESAQLLGLRPGVAVQALCKATAVQVQAVAAAPSQPSPSEANHWLGRALRVARGSLGDEVLVQLPAGNPGVQLVGFAAAGSGLRARSRVSVSVAESAWVLALV